jgi:hypothetical protein
MKRHTTLLIAFLLSFQVQYSQKYNRKKMKFDSSITVFSKINADYKEDIKYPKLVSELNLLSLLNNRRKVQKINFSDTSFFPSYWKLPLNKIVGAYIYGTKDVFSNELFLYTEIYSNELDKVNEMQYHETGLILIKNKDKLVSSLKVFETDIDSEKFLESFLFDNYVICIETTDWGYDIVDNANKKKVEYKYVVFKISEQGNILRLDKIESRKILFRYM